MTETYSQDYSGQQLFADLATRLRDIEDRQQLLKDRTLLIGQSIIKEREKLLKEITQLKAALQTIASEHERVKALLQRITEQLASTARKEEVALLQRQLDLLRQ